MSDKRNWKIIYSNYSGPEKKAVELVNKEMGSQILRDAGIYTIHVLSCEKINRAVIDKNAVVIGTYSESEIIQKYIDISEIPQDGYVVKVMDNPELCGFKLVLITALKPREVFYGAVDFVDDYFAKASPIRSELTFPDEVFEQKLPDYYNASAPKIKTRCIFTWGHPISDYMNYIDNMARLKLNELIIWNDYAPVNAQDIVKYAHEYGIKIIWGYAWGWSRNCNNIDLEKLDELTDAVIKKYDEEYANSGGDGIYFQSFTELHQDYIGDKLIAEVVTDFVNKTADKLFSKYPDLHLQFGLHAISVKNHLELIGKVDKRVSIIWEDCGEFPYSCNPYIKNMADYEKSFDFTDKILSLRKNSSDGVLYKGQVILDWDGEHFAHQSGPFVMGMASKKTIKNDIEILRPIWKKYQNQWLKNGKYAYEMTNYILKTCKDSVTVGMAAQLAGGIWFSEALLSQILWECDKPYDEILEKVLNRRCIDMV